MNFKSGLYDFYLISQKTFITWDQKHNHLEIDLSNIITEYIAEHIRNLKYIFHNFNNDHTAFANDHLCRVLFNKIIDSNPKPTKPKQELINAYNSINNTFFTLTVLESYGIR